MFLSFVTCSANHNIQMQPPRVPSLGMVSFQLGNHVGGDACTRSLSANHKAEKHKNGRHCIDDTDAIPELFSEDAQVRSTHKWSLFNSYPVLGFMFCPCFAGNKKKSEFLPTDCASKNSRSCFLYITKMCRLELFQGVYPCSLSEVFLRRQFLSTLTQFLGGCFAHVFANKK